MQSMLPEGFPFSKFRLKTKMSVKHMIDTNWDMQRIMIDVFQSYQLSRSIFAPHYVSVSHLQLLVIMQKYSRKHCRIVSKFKKKENSSVSASLHISSENYCRFYSCSVGFISDNGFSLPDW